MHRKRVVLLEPPVLRVEKVWFPGKIQGPETRSRGIVEGQVRGNDSFRVSSGIASLCHTCPSELEQTAEPQFPHQTRDISELSQF